jgi:hypothetical protein
LPDWALQAIERLQTGRETDLDRLWADPGTLFRAAGMEPDGWQLDLLRSPAGRLLLLCSRQAGKSELAAALALHTALLQPEALVLLLSPSERQSGELAAKVFHQYDAAGRPVAATKRTELQLHLSNGSRVIALPGKEATVRGYSGAGLLVIDEAARVADELYYAVRPMLAVSKGRLIALSTPFGKRGWFHEEWAWVKPDGSPRPAAEDPWQRTQIKASECPRIAAGFLAEERAALGPRWFRQEYECSFEDAVASLFAYEDLMAACANDLKPLALPE